MHRINIGKSGHRQPLTAGRLTLLSLALTAALATLEAHSQTVISVDTYSQVPWTSGDLTVNSSILITSTTAVAATGASLGTLSNNGIIMGSVSGSGINNSGTISALNNSAFIAAIAGSAIYSNGSITALTNNTGGTIRANGTGIDNAGNLDTLTNSSNATISSNLGTGIHNSGSIGTLNNSGNIAAGSGNNAYAINNSGTIGTLNNGGTITGGSGSSAYAINNSGTIGTLSNSGNISSSTSSAISNSSNNTITSASITALINNAGGTISGYSTAILNNGTIGMLSNSGVLSGGYYDGINNNGTIVVLSNSGTIIGSNSNSGNSGTGIANYGLINTLTNNADGIISGTVSSSISNSYGISNSNEGTIVALSNSGTIIGSNSSQGSIGIGIDNNGLINTLTNNAGGIIIGTVANSIGNSSSYGIRNSNDGTIVATIVALSNSGTIIGSNNNQGSIGSGIANDALINTLTNNAGGSIIGTVSGGIGYGINNGGTIGTLSNDGLIMGNRYGIANLGTIAALSNNGTGTIQGGGSAVNNGGTIGILSNSGTINSRYGIGIRNSGTISTLSNSGIVSGGTSSNGIYNTGTIGSLRNSGTITGGNYAIVNDQSGSIGAITNSGVIAGYITNSSSYALTINGGTGSVFGTLTGYGGYTGMIYSTASNLVFGTGNLLLNDNINVSSNTVINSAATLQVNTPVNITGNYSQDAAATLKIGVSDSAVISTGTTSDSGYGRLLVSGSATIATGSTVALAKVNSYAFAQGQRYVVVVANTSGTNYNASGLTYTTVDGHSVSGASVVDGSNTDLVLTVGGIASSGSSGLSGSSPSSGSSSPINLATAANAIAPLSGLFSYTGLNQNLMNLSNDAIVVAGTSSAAANRIGVQLSPASNTAAAAQSSTAATQTVFNVANAHVDNLRVAQARGDSGVATGESAASLAAWGQAFGGAANQGQRDGSGYNARYNGLLLGADRLFGDQLRAGGLLSYANTSVADSGDSAGSSSHVTAYGLIAYASYSGNPWYVNLSAGAVQHQYSTVRQIDLSTSSLKAAGRFNGMQYVTAVQAGYPIKLGAALLDATVTPIAGLTYSQLRQNGYTESGSAAALSVKAANSSSLKSDLGVKLERSFATGYGELLPMAQLGWRHEYHDRAPQSVSNFSADASGATSFTSQGTAPLGNTGVLALGATLVRSQNLSLSAKYTVEAASGYAAQTADLQLRYQF